MKRLKSGIDFDDSSNRQDNNSELVDAISSLPDSILGCILSFLTTKEAIWTSVLSKRWKLVWVRVQSLDFSYVGCWKKHDEDENMKFIRFVNRVLLVNDVGLINKFSLVWHPWCKSSHCSSWINTAITRNVRHLSLSGEFDLPISVFSCDSLMSLELKGRIYVPDTFVVCLPRLERLELDGVDFKSEEAFEKLINGCSMLYYLCLDIYSNDDDDFTYIISSASLRRFELCFKHKCSLKLKASSLEYIEVFGCMSETFVQENLSSLVGAYFSIHLLRDEFFQDGICNSIVGAVGAFDCGKALNLSADVMRPITRFHPGRVFNMLRRQSLRPDNIEMFVLQEAVLSSESEDQIYDIFQLLPPKIQVGLFTATMPPGPYEITREFMYKPVSMFVKHDQHTLMGTSHVYMNVENENHKLEKLFRVFESVGANVRIVIFVNTRRKVDWLTNKMRGRGRTVYAIHGDMDQNTRDIVEHKFHSSFDDVLITTNLFANVREVNLVINYDLPTQPEKYLPRSGRFGRRKKGIAISFTTPDEEKIITREFMNVLTLEGIEQLYINVENENQKLVGLSRLIQSPAANFGRRIVIFVNTRRKVDWLTDKMSGHGHTVYAIRGDMDQTTRDIILRNFCSGSSPVLITTNLFAGSIDIQGLTLVVINYDLPTQVEKYLHRITLFGGKNGIAMSLTTPDEEKMVFEIQKFYNVEMEKWRV